MSAILAMANTHDQLDKSFMLRLKAILQECDIQFVHGCRPPPNWQVPLREKYKKWDNILTLDSGHIIVTGTMDEPDNVRGGEYGLAILDEAAFAANRKAMTIIMGCMRCKYATKHIIRIATSPNGFNWFYHDFAGPKAKKGYEMIRAQTFDNKSLPETYFDMLEGLEDAMYRQEVLGEFVSSGDTRIYSEYDPNIHDDNFEYIPGLEIRIGCDFNVSPMCWVIGQEYQGKIHIFDEIFIKDNATTYAACQEVLKKYPNSSIYAYPDATAKLRRTTGKVVTSDLNVMTEAGFKCTLPGGKNPPVAERIERVQRRFRDKRLFIGASCDYLKESLLGTTYNPGDRKPKKSKEAHDVGEHPTDALGYLIYTMDNFSSIEAVPYCL